MYGEILHAAESGQSVVGERAGPHQLTHGIIVLWILHSNAALGNNGAQKRFCDGIGQLIFIRIEIPVHGVHHDIGHAAGYLVRRQRHGQLRVHDGKARAVQLRA